MGPKSPHRVEDPRLQRISPGSFSSYDLFAVEKMHCSFGGFSGVQRLIAHRGLPRLPWFQRGLVILNRSPGG